MADKEKIETTADFEIKVEEGWEPVHIDEGIYDAALMKLEMMKDVSVVDPKTNETKVIDMLKWTFMVRVDSSGEEEDVELQATSSYKFTSNSKAFGWAEKLLSRKIKVGEQFKPSDLTGKSCQVVVEDDEREFNNKKTIVSKITKVMPPKKPKGKKEQR